MGCVKPDEEHLQSSGESEKGKKIKEENTKRHFCPSASERRTVKQEGGAGRGGARGVGWGEGLNRV